jgi:hypothetical protein
MDALMVAGGKRQWLDSHRRERFSETVGYLQPQGNRVERLVIGRSDVADDLDTTILFPNPLEGTDEHEYYFHTHPATPKPGARVVEGILYEFPSPDDVMHFLSHLAYGKTRGSIVLAPEGAYILTRLQGAKLSIPKTAYRDYYDVVVDVQKRSVAHFAIGRKPPSLNVFYNRIAQDRQWVRRVDRLLRTWGLRVHYRPRINVNGRWIVDGGKLPL